MPADTMDDLLETIDLGSATGGRRFAAPLQLEIARSLTEEDLPLLQAPPPQESAGQRLLAVKHSHHQLAQLLATGTVSDTEAGLIVGYSPAYISSLKGDPAFEELLAQYRQHSERVFIDTVERMRGLGLRFVEELEERLEQKPEKWSARELMEAVELLMLRPQAAIRGQGGPAQPAVSVNVKFVTSDGVQPQNSMSEPVTTLDYEDIT